MDQIKIDIPQREFMPGETLYGTLSWNVNEAPKTVTLRIGWTTDGSGSTDSHIEHEQNWNTIATSGTETFSFALPAAPYSFSGKLIELTWYISAETAVGKFEYQHTLVVGPNKRPVVL